MTKKSRDKRFSVWFPYICNVMCLNSQQQNEQVIGKGLKKVFLTLKNYVINECGLEIVYVDYTDGCLGIYDEDDQIIELSKKSSLGEKTLTLAHELGHVLTYSSKRKAVYNEVLAEAFAYLVVLFFGLGITGFSYLQKMKKHQKYLVRKRQLLYNAFSEITNHAVS